MPVLIFEFLQHLCISIDNFNIESIVIVICDSRTKIKLWADEDIRFDVIYLKIMLGEAIKATL